MSCKYEKNIDALLKGKLNENKEMELRDHGKECDECGRKLMEIDTIDNTIKNQLSQYPFMGGKDKIMARVKNKRNKAAVLSSLYNCRKYAYAMILIFTLVISVYMLKAFFNNKANKQDVNNVSKITSIQDISLDRIKSVKIVQASTGADKKEDLYFDLNKIQHKQILIDIINALRGQPLKCDEMGEFVQFKIGSPAYLLIQCKDGSTVKILSARGYTETRIPNGIEISCPDIEGQITVITSFNPKAIRIYSPEIKNFINGKYKDIF